MQPLYDWTPVFRLMIVGLLVAAGPLVWVWLRSRGASPGSPGRNRSGA